MYTESSSGRDDRHCLFAIFICMKHLPSSLKHLILAVFVFGFKNSCLTVFRLPVDEFAFLFIVRRVMSDVKNVVENKK